MKTGIFIFSLWTILISNSQSTKVEIKTKSFGTAKKLVIQTIKPLRDSSRKLDEESVDQDEDETEHEVETQLEHLNEGSEIKSVEVFRPDFGDAGKLVYLFTNYRHSK